MAKFIKLYVVFKPNTSRVWALDKIMGVGYSPLCRVGDFMKIDKNSNLRAVVLIHERDEMHYSKAIRMISPQVISVSRA